MSNQDRYIPGVPCWIDITQPDPQAAVAFYGELFGWQFEDVMPPESPAPYFVARLEGGDVAAVTSQPEGSPPAWNTYIWVADADETAAKVRAAGGSVLREPVEAAGGAEGRGGGGPHGRVRRSRRRRLQRLAAEPAPRRGGRQRARLAELQRP